MADLFPVVVVGSGNMGAALARCLRNANPDASILGVDPDRTRLAQLEAEGILKAAAPDWTLHRGTLVLAVKPQVLESVAAALKPRLGPDVVVVSILAGVPLARLRGAMGSEKIVRTMPNLALTVGAGATAIATDGCSPEVLARAKSLLASTGEVVEVLESQLDAVTGLSGSGPAFVLKFLMALEDGGVFAGLPRATARKLANATVAGTLRMVLESGAEPDVLRGQVTSPGGTTIYGLHALERGGFAASVMEAVQAATLRSKELGKA
jgi:pyrroline-5-carboxylate reductase